MRLKLSALFLIIAISGCTFQVDVIETPTPNATAVPTESSTSTQVPTSEQSVTPPPVSTSIPTTIALPASAITPQGSVFPVQFAPNGTYVDILESLKAGESKTYSVNALKGQVMSVSFHQNDESEWAYITMRIVGADNSVLCEEDCQFWRGVLPVTQNYFVTVTPAADANDIMMRVAINPLGTETQSFLYENKYRNASLTYTDVFAPAFFPGAAVYRIEPELVLQFIDTQSYENTNLSEAYLLFGSSTDPQIGSVCTEPATVFGQQTLPEDVTIHGITYAMYSGVDVGAGNIYDQVFYHTVHDGTCFEIVYFMHYTNMDNYSPGTVTEFDRDALLQGFDEVLSTLTLK